MESVEQWKSPRAIEAERRALRLKVGSALADCVLEKLMQPDEAKEVFQGQFPEVIEATK